MNLPATHKSLFEFVIEILWSSPAAAADDDEEDEWEFRFKAVTKAENWLLNVEAAGEGEALLLWHYIELGCNVLLSTELIIFWRKDKFTRRYRLLFELIYIY